MMADSDPESCLECLEATQEVVSKLEVQHIHPVEIKRFGLNME